MNQNATQSPSSSKQKKDLEYVSTYQIDGRQFIITPVFREESNETLGTVLLRLMENDAVSS